MSCEAWKWTVIVTLAPLVVLRLWWMLPRYWFNADENLNFARKAQPFLRDLALLALVLIVAVFVYAGHCDP